MRADACRGRRGCGRWLSTVLLLGALSLVAAEGGGGPFIDTDTGVDGEIVITGGASGGGGGGTTTGGPWPPAPTGPPMERVDVRSIENVAGEDCILVQARLYPVSEAGAVRHANTASFFLEYDRLTADGTVLQECPGSTTTVTLAPVWAFVDRVRGQLPRPTLELEPDGRAITGNAAYLETNRPLRYGPVTETLDLGAFTTTVTVYATGSYTVAWGDSPAGPATTDGVVRTVPGSPYPGTGEGGRVDHTYIDAGTYTLTVSDTWDLTIRVDGYGELQRTLPLEARSIAVTVDEVRSDRDS